jgi:hypothetical protein
MIDRLAVLTAGAAMLTTAVDRPVGEGRIPDGNPDPPYYVLDLVGHRPDGAPYSDLNEDSSTVLQVKCVAEQLDQALWLADKASRAFIERDQSTGQWLNDIPVPGAKVFCRAVDSEPGDTSDPSAAIVSYVLRIRLDLTSAAP